MEFSGSWFVESHGLTNVRGRFGFKPRSEAKPLHALVSSGKPADVSKVNLDDRNPETLQAISLSLSNCLTETHLDETVPGLGPRIRGKVKLCAIG